LLKGYINRTAESSVKALLYGVQSIFLSNHLSLVHRVVEPTVCCEMKNGAWHRVAFYDRAGEFDVENPRADPYLGKREGVPVGWGLLCYHSFHGCHQIWVNYLHVATQLVASEASQKIGLVQDMVGE
jgi:hypothetical protein